MTDRYYTAQILDEWGEVIVNINERTFPSQPFGKFALVKPGSTAKIPDDAARIELHSGKAKMLARVELKGDPEGALRLQKQFKVTPLGNEKPLNGTNNYVIHFPSDRLPSTVVNSYWSVILVSVPDYRVVPNPLNRFNFNSHSPLRSEADGGLKIAIGPKPVAGVAESNWLPSAPGKPFSLTFRAYVPKELVKRGEWTPRRRSPQRNKKGDKARGRRDLHAFEKREDAKRSLQLVE